MDFLMPSNIPITKGTFIAMHWPRKKLRDRPPSAQIRRSVKNILDWNTYLSPACVRAMVKMGWDYTT